MKSFKELKEDKRLHVVFFVVVALYSFYLVMNMFFVFGEIHVCSNMNGSIVKDNGNTVCIFTNDIPLCTDGFGVVYKDMSNISFNFSSISID